MDFDDITIIESEHVPEGTLFIVPPLPPGEARDDEAYERLVRKWLEMWTMVKNIGTNPEAD
jgi:hypothetical protein